LKSVVDAGRRDPERKRMRGKKTAQREHQTVFYD